MKQVNWTPSCKPRAWEGNYFKINFIFYQPIIMEQINFDGFLIDFSLSTPYSAWIHLQKRFCYHIFRFDLLFSAHIASLAHTLPIKLAPIIIVQFSFSGSVGRALIDLNLLKTFIRFCFLSWLQFLFSVRLRRNHYVLFSFAVTSLHTFFLSLLYASAPIISSPCCLYLFEYLSQFKPFF